MTDGCRIDFCREPSEAWRHHDFNSACFCHGHAVAFNHSPEFARVDGAREQHRLTRAIYVSALFDFRTRIELEHRNGSTT